MACIFKPSFILITKHSILVLLNASESSIKTHTIYCKEIKCLVRDHLAYRQGSQSLKLQERTQKGMGIFFSLGSVGVALKSV